MTRSPAGFDDFDRDRLVRAIRRWIGLVAAATVLAGGVAFVVSKLTPPQYEATAQLYLAPASNPTVSFQDVALGQSLAATYVQLATANVVLDTAKEKIGWTDSDAAFRAGLQVSQIRNTSIITVTFRSGNPARAAAAANAVAESFIEQSRALQTALQGSAATELDQQVRATQADIQSLNDQITSMRSQLAASPRPGEPPSAKADLQTQIIQLDASRQSKQQTLAQLLKTRDDMRLAQARAETTVSLWQPATPPDDAVSPRPVPNAVLGALAGGFVAIIGVALIAYVDDRLTDLDEVRRRLRIPSLGQVRLHEHPETLVGKLFVRDEPSSREAEAIRGIRTNLLFAALDKRPRILLVTSAAPTEGKSVLSANLALTFAEGGTAVTLVDADLRRPSQHRLFRIPASNGLTNLLAESVSGPQLETFRVAPRLMVIPCGPIPPNPAELLGSGRMTVLLRYLSTLAENSLVIVDSSPVLAVADAVALATKVDGCIIVIDSSRTRVALVRRAISALEQVHAPILGAVLNKLPEEDTSYFQYDKYYDARADPRPSTTAASRTGAKSG
jgi:capsular exopolysaccharide synthesis family protein